MYTINYNNGIKAWWDVDLEMAMEIADDGASYTQSNITIEEDGDIVAIRRWYGVPDNESDINFGEYGHYSDWDFE